MIEDLIYRAVEHDTKYYFDTKDYECIAVGLLLLYAKFTKRKSLSPFMSTYPIIVSLTDGKSFETEIPSISYNDEIYGPYTLMVSSFIDDEICSWKNALITKNKTYIEKKIDIEKEYNENIVLWNENSSWNDFDLESLGKALYEFMLPVFQKQDVIDCIFSGIGLLNLILITIESGASSASLTLTKCYYQDKDYGNWSILFTEKDFMGLNSSEIDEEFLLEKLESVLDDDTKLIKSLNITYQDDKIIEGSIFIKNKG